MQLLEVFGFWFLVSCLVYLERNVPRWQSVFPFGFSRACVARKVRQFVDVTCLSFFGEFPLGTSYMCSTSVTSCPPRTCSEADSRRRFFVVSSVTIFCC